MDRLADKYLRAVSFFAPGKVVSVLWGRLRDFEEYLYILADEIPQMAERVLGRRCRIGVSRTAGSPNALHTACCEAMEALRQGDRTHSSSATRSLRSRGERRCAGGRWRRWTSAIWTRTSPWYP